MNPQPASSTAGSGDPAVPGDGSGSLGPAPTGADARVRDGTAVGRGPDGGRGAKLEDGRVEWTLSAAEDVKRGSSVRPDDGRHGSTSLANA